MRFVSQGVVRVQSCRVVLAATKADAALYSLRTASRGMPACVTRGVTCDFRLTGYLLRLVVRRATADNGKRRVVLLRMKHLFNISEKKRGNIFTEF